MKELKEALSFAIALGNALGDSMEDGRLDYTDMALLWTPLMRASDAFSGSGKILKEIHGLDDTRKRELLAYIKSEFDIPQDSIEAAVELGLEILLGIMKFISEVKK